MSKNSPGDPPEREVRVREEAYKLWDSAGRPEGRSEEFWGYARERVAIRERTQSSKRKRGQKPTPVRPETAEDREYLKMMYEEQAEHARSHEELRGAATSLFMALIAGLLAFAVTEGADPRREWVAGAMIIGVSLVGSLVSYKHYERYEMHLSRLRGFRYSLELGVKEALRLVNKDWTDYHNEQYRFSHKWLRG